MLAGRVYASIRGFLARVGGHPDAGLSGFGAQGVLRTARNRPARSRSPGARRRVIRYFLTSPGRFNTIRTTIASLTTIGDGSAVGAVVDVAHCFRRIGRGGAAPPVHAAGSGSRGASRGGLGRLP